MGTNWLPHRFQIGGEHWKVCSSRSGTSSQAKQQQFLEWTLTQSRGLISCSLNQPNQVSWLWFCSWRNFFWYFSDQGETGCWPLRWTSWNITGADGGKNAGDELTTGWEWNKNLLQGIDNRCLYSIWNERRWKEGSSFRLWRLSFKTCKQGNPYR